MFLKPFCILIFIFFVTFSNTQTAAPEEIVIGSVIVQTFTFVFNISGQLTPLSLPITPETIVALFGESLVNANPLILPNTNLTVLPFDAGSDGVKTLEGIEASYNAGAVAICGPSLDAEAGFAFRKAESLGLPIVSPIVADPQYLGSEDFPYVRALVSQSKEEIIPIIAIIHHFYEESGQSQWLDVGVITSSRTEQVSISTLFIKEAQESDPQINIIANQQILSFIDNDILDEFNPGRDAIVELKRSGARVFVGFALATDFVYVYQEAITQEIVGPNYVWICYNGCAFSTNYVDVVTNFPNRTLLPELYQNQIGLIATQHKRPSGPLYDLLLQEIDDFYASFGIEEPAIISGDFLSQIPDTITALSIAIDGCLRQGLNLTSENIINRFSNMTFTGLTGNITFDEFGFRKPTYSIVNLWDINEPYFTDDLLFAPLNYFVEIGEFNETGLSFFPDRPVRFFDSSTKIPDLDIRDPFDYWSCPDREKKTDETGKAISLDTPGVYASYLDTTYICDEYIDCYNMSDEMDCSASITIAQIVFAFIIFFLILITISFIIFTCVFGCCIKRQKVRALSPPFLIIMCLAGIVGYISLFSFYGMATIVSCPIRPWLVSLSIAFLIGALVIKSFRIWTLYRAKQVVREIKDWQLVILLFILIIPVVFINFLWTLLATPTASEKERDGNTHYICNTGGFINHDAAGYTFFGLLVAYISLILLFGAFISFMTRNVAAHVNESKLIAISIYNLFFVGLNHFIFINIWTFFDHL
eukprot:TRINITY_DN2817_c0_g1_i2.p1 TRINITY_DN2817_c0_g1~~TRINITY_DN2817_c0_g1_i2.p1  ORF type:complete len:760 (-),score=215.36 TRINITY_DN2817_c0_g1_i2:436-2715(-)